MKTDSTFWSQLSAQIDSYKRRAKIDLEKYQKKRFNSLYKKKKQKTLNTSESEQFPQKISYSINLIRDWKRQQVEKTQMIQCKLNFLQTQRNRKIISSDRTKKKLDRVFNIRSTSSIQKSFCEKEIKEFKIKNYEIKRDITQKTKSERARIEQERNKIQQENLMKAEQVRVQRINNEQSILQQKQADLSKKKKAVEIGQAQYQKIIEKKKARQQSIVQAGKQAHYNKIRQEFSNYEKVKKRNLQFMNYFKKESKKIIDQTIKAQENLITFQSVLMLRKNNKRQTNRKYLSFKQYPSTTHSNQKNQSIGSKTQAKLNNFFHLTN